MRKKFLTLIGILALTNSLLATTKPTLLFYCGITMVKPMTKIAKIIEKKDNCIIKISQGGSEDLYESLAASKIGDLYLPGSESYRTKHLKDGYLLDAKEIGYNQAAIFVQKDNPKNIKSLDDFLREDIRSMLCNPKSGSIGKMTKKILIKYKGKEFFEDVYDAIISMSSDSRNLNKTLIEKDIDMTINWRATGFWPENKLYITVIDLPKKLAPKKKLVINLLSFSKHKKIAKDFINFATSKEGQKIMKEYGFR